MSIRGNTIGTTSPRADWAEQDPTKASFIRNKPGIDEIIIQIEEENIFAPAGYGLNNNFKTTANASDFDNYVTIGWYRYVNYSEVTLVPGFIVYYAICRVDSYSTNYFVQTLYTISYPGCALQRYYRNGAWSEWEWVNPPMASGVEYRTTDRYKGSAVYKKVDAEGNILWRKDGDTKWHLLSAASYVANATVE